MSEERAKIIRQQLGPDIPDVDVKAIENEIKNLKLSDDANVKNERDYLLLSKEINELQTEFQERKFYIPDGTSVTSREAATFVKEADERKQKAVAAHEEFLRLQKSNPEEAGKKLTESLREMEKTQELFKRAIDENMRSLVYGARMGSQVQSVRLVWVAANSLAP